MVTGQIVRSSGQPECQDRRDGTVVKHVVTDFCGSRDTPSQVQLYRFV